ncbi:cupin domain-containing protein [Thiotrichales bacterium 19X7-9]|nr:cupin domain-containing protein [Thiotrichales bacterium 19X7-9]
MTEIKARRVILGQNSLNQSDILEDSILGNTLHLNAPPLTDEQKNDKHPLMHQVNSLVYYIVLQGKIHIILDNSETELNPGDCIIDMGSKHAWSNKTDKIALMAFILLDAKR